MRVPLWRVRWLQTQRLTRFVGLVRGLHAYHWEPAVGETLQLKREPDNHRDKHAVAVVKADVAIVGIYLTTLLQLFHHSWRETSQPRLLGTE